MLRLPPRAQLENVRVDLLSKLRELGERPDCVAGLAGFELRNVVANYPFERSHRYVGI
jgi:hypothetical protein